MCGGGVFWLVGEVISKNLEQQKGSGCKLPTGGKYSGWDCLSRDEDLF